MAETIKAAGGREWTLREFKTLGDMSAFTEQVTNLKNLGVDISQEVLTSFGGLLADGQIKSVMAMTGIGPLFLHTGRLACLVRAMCVIEPSFNQQLEARMNTWTPEEGASLRDALLPFFLAKWGETFLASVNTFLGSLDISDQGKKAKTAGKSTSTSGKGSVPNSSSSEQAVTAM